MSGEGGYITGGEARARPNHPHRHNQGLILLWYTSNQCDYISSDLGNMRKHTKTNHEQDQTRVDTITLTETTKAYSFSCISSDLGNLRKHMKTNHKEDKTREDLIILRDTTKASSVSCGEKSHIAFYPRNATITVLSHLLQVVGVW